ncbi:MFS general substrate transporter [Cenococcum geophilum 1.58]|uniref:MFS general substrate transporter n=1 Tax=Cenococcum geophilum 1.58 TaxID=794803 RepID=UPI003590014F|nr:MFS general substrate transporter [Cenococcum geophilum 1.58]
MNSIRDQEASIGRHNDLELHDIRHEADSTSGIARLERTDAPSLHSGTESRRSAQHRRRAILTVLASFVLTFTGCGLNFAFGVYQELYETLPGPFAHASPGTIDLIGTLAASLMTIGAPLASAWTKVYTPRTVTLIGGTLLLLANTLASLSTQLWHFLLAQGVLLGCATCLSYIPAVTIAPGWFDARRGLAMGIILSGTGVGGVVWAPALRALNAAIGFRNTLRLTGGIGFALVSAAAMALEWDPASAARIAAERPSPPSRRPARRSRLFPALRSTLRTRIPLVNWRIANSRLFVAEAAGAALQAAAYYTPVYFFSSYARSLGYSAAAGASFIAASNASSAVGKVLLGYTADRAGRLNTLLFCTLGFGGNDRARALFVAFAVLYGVFAGAYVSLFPTVLVELFGVQNFASVNGFLYMVRGFGTLLGTPVAGALIHSGGARVAVGFGRGGRAAGEYAKSSVMVGALLAAATVSVLWVRLEVGGVGRWKA